MKKTLLLIAILLINIVASAQSIPNYIDTTALKAWYPFDNTINRVDNYFAQPSTGYAPYYLQPKLAVDRNGKTDNAYEFFGASPDSLNKSHIDLSNTHFTKQSATFTISLWVRKTLDVKGAYILSEYNKTFAIGTDNDSTFVRANGVYYTTKGIFDTNWHHIVCLFKKANPPYNAQHLQLYIDDSLMIDEVNAMQPIPSNFIIGFNNTTAINSHAYPIQKGMMTGFKGRIDDIAMWDRAITRAEVSELYNAVDTPKNVSVKDIIYNNPNITIAPNPAQNFICVKHTMKITNVEIYNMSGALVYRNNPNTTLTKIDISNMAHGTYIVKVNNSISKILKQ